MSISLISGIAAIFAYLASSFVLLERTKLGSAKKEKSWPKLSLLTIALVTHSISLYPQIVSAQGYHFSFFPISSLIFLFITALGLFALLKRQAVNSLLALVLPMAALAILCSLVFSSNYNPRNDMHGGMAAHILFSVLAFSVLTLAAVQAILLAVQMAQLKHRNTHGLIDALPPLQTMEWLLSQLLTLGFGLLTIALALGFIYVEDLFAQHLVHKTFFSILAWVIFATLLWGRIFQGWRGKTAVRWTLIGMGALMIGFFGSKLVLEVLLPSA